MKNSTTKKIFNRYNIFILFLCFSEFSFTQQLTEKEKVEFIESLAQPSSEKKNIL